MKYLLAISGGVDSVVLLDMAKKGFLDLNGKLYVAHIDHGIRQDSANDARFVETLARLYGVDFFVTRLNLGEGTSEEAARSRRYEFLHTKAKELGANIVTAHHLDDVVESVSINITRGTGWRGLAVMNRKSITRPLLKMTKSEIYDYAMKNNLEWAEDSTNNTDIYLRNRLRQKTMKLDLVTKKAIGELAENQRQKSKDIANEIKKLPLEVLYDRHMYTMISDNISLEMLRAAIIFEGIVPPMNSQLMRALVAIKTSLPGKICQIGDGVFLEFSKRRFVVCTS